MLWYYADGGAQKGPVSDQDFQGLVESGRIGPKTLVWHDGMAAWVAYETLLKTAAEPPSAAVPAPAGEPAATSGTCRECGRIFPLDDMILYEGKPVCAACKATFFQRIQEGAAGGGGHTPNRDLMTQARDALTGKWWLTVAVVFVSELITNAVTNIPFCIGFLIYFVIVGPMMVGLASYFLSVARGAPSRFAMMFDGFPRFGVSFLTALLWGLFISLWTLLLIVPGIIAAFAYSMVFYIVADDPSVDAMGALRRSKEMMRGHKWKLFCLQFRFIGWYLLCIIPIGLGIAAMIPLFMTLDSGSPGLMAIGGLILGFVLVILGSGCTLFVASYFNASIARFYDDVRGTVAT